MYCLHYVEDSTDDASGHGVLSRGREKSIPGRKRLSGEVY